MRTYHANEIGNVAVLGHSGCGKTSIVEAMAYRAGSLARLGKVSDGNTISDYDEEEIVMAGYGRSVDALRNDSCKLCMCISIYSGIYGVYFQRRECG